MLRSVVVGQFYKDLTNPAYNTAFAIYHRRFSTNTNPRWPLAQPMRVLGHNGAPQLVVVLLVARPALPWTLLLYKLEIVPGGCTALASLACSAAYECAPLRFRRV